MAGVMDKALMTYFFFKITSSYIVVVSSLQEVTKSASQVHVTRMFNTTPPHLSKKGKQVKTYATLQFIVNDLVCNRRQSQLKAIEQQRP